MSAHPAAAAPQKVCAPCGAGVSVAVIDRSFSAANPGGRPGFGPKARGASRSSAPNFHLSIWSRSFGRGDRSKFLGGKPRWSTGVWAESPRRFPVLRAELSPLNNKVASGGLEITVARAARRPKVRGESPAAATERSARNCGTDHYRRTYRTPGRPVRAPSPPRRATPRARSP